MFAGVEALRERYASWPKASSCPLTPKGGYRPIVRDPSVITGDPVTDLAHLRKAVVKHTIGTKPSSRSYTAGHVVWLVGIGDAIEPGQDLLRVGDTTIKAQPKLKEPAENKPLYVANLLIEGGISLPVLKTGTPLLVAVWDRAHIVRFEQFVPSPTVLQQLR
jgi:hypothetical protein